LRRTWMKCRSRRTASPSTWYDNYMVPLGISSGGGAGGQACARRRARCGNARLDGILLGALFMAARACYWERRALDRPHLHRMRGDPAARAVAHRRVVPIVRRIAVVAPARYAASAIRARPCWRILPVIGACAAGGVPIVFSLWMGAAGIGGLERGADSDRLGAVMRGVGAR